MNAVIVSIGDEILIGQVVDTNSAWIAEQLSLMGISIKEIISISDCREHINSTLEKYESKIELVILTGGLGPTRDDITKQTLADYFDSELVVNSDVLANIRELFRLRGMKVTEVNESQALVPVSCKILRNPSGTAPGMWFERNGTVFISVPGVPYEMMDILNTQVFPDLSGRIDGMVFIHKTIMTQGIPESYLSVTLKDWELSLPENIKLAYLPHPGIVRLRLTGIGNDRNSIEKQLDAEADKLKNYLPGDIFSFTDEPLENVIGRLLLEKGKFLATAESCTGGNIARLITSVPGSSEYFTGAIVAYSNNIKIDHLKVNASLINRHGVVSKEVVEDMAKGAINFFSSDYAIAVSGIAGPSGGTKDKPVGTTWIAVSSKDKIVSKKFCFGEHRGRNIQKASFAALNMLRKLILGFPDHQE